MDNLYTKIMQWKIEVTLLVRELTSIVLGSLQGPFIEKQYRVSVSRALKKFFVSQWNCNVVNSFFSNWADLPGQLRWEPLLLKQSTTFFRVYILSFKHLNGVGKFLESYANPRLRVRFA